MRTVEVAEWKWQEPRQPTVWQDPWKATRFDCMAVGYHFMEEMAFYLTSNPRIEKQLYQVVLYLSICCTLWLHEIQTLDAFLFFKYFT